MWAGLLKVRVRWRVALCSLPMECFYADYSQEIISPVEDSAVFNATCVAYREARDRKNSPFNAKCGSAAHTCDWLCRMQWHVVLRLKSMDGVCGLAQLPIFNGRFAWVRLQTVHERISSRL